MEGTQRLRHANVNDHWRGESPYTPVTLQGILKLLVTLAFGWHIAVLIFSISAGRFHVDMFTYWNYVIVTFAWLWLFLALWMERWWLTLFALLMFPLVLGTTWVVNVTIVMVIQINSAVFSDAICQNVTGDADTAVSLIHTGDWILHDLPFMMGLILLGAGLNMYMRAVLGPELNGLYNANWRWAYQAYFVLVPLVPLGLYSLIFDISVHYPTGMETWVLWLCLLTVNCVWQCLWFQIFTCSGNVELQLGTLAPLFNRQSLVSSGKRDEDMTPPPPPPPPSTSLLIPATHESPSFYTPSAVARTPVSVIL